MPYIDQTDRDTLQDLDNQHAQTPGELNYLITRLCHQYLVRKKLSYNTLNDIMGVLACASQEFYRRKVAPYEDLKIEENGDV